MNRVIVLGLISTHDDEITLRVRRTVLNMTQRIMKALNDADVKIKIKIRIVCFCTACTGLIKHSANAKVWTTKSTPSLNEAFSINFKE